MMRVQPSRQAKRRRAKRKAERHTKSSRTVWQIMRGLRTILNFARTAGIGARPFILLGRLSRPVAANQLHSKSWLRRYWVLDRRTQSANGSGNSRRLRTRSPRCRLARCSNIAQTYLKPWARWRGWWIQKRTVTENCFWKCLGTMTPRAGLR